MKTKDEIEQLAEKLYIEPLNKQGEQRTHTPKSGGMYGFKKFKKYFTLGYTQCQEDMADKKYTFNQMVDAIQMAREINGKETYYKYSIEQILESLNKQD